MKLRLNESLFNVLFWRLLHQQINVEMGVRQFCLLAMPTSQSPDENFLKSSAVMFPIFPLRHHFQRSESHTT
ncbi:uncharacterized [Tachysurus ichikawai]